MPQDLAFLSKGSVLLKVPIIVWAFFKGMIWHFGKLQAYSFFWGERRDDLLMAGPPIGEISTFFLIWLYFF